MEEEPPVPLTPTDEEKKEGTGEGIQGPREVSGGGGGVVEDPEGVSFAGGGPNESSFSDGPPSLSSSSSLSSSTSSSSRIGTYGLCSHETSTPGRRGEVDNSCVFKNSPSALVTDCRRSLRSQEASSFSFPSFRLFLPSLSTPVAAVGQQEAPGSRKDDLGNMVASYASCNCVGCTQK